MKHQLQLLAALLIVLAATSCRTRTQMVYLTDLTPGTDYPVQPTKDLVIQTDDKVTIKVTCKNPELALAFNVPTGGYSISSEGNISSTSNSNSDSRYTVADDGTIDFPIIGKIQARGLTCRQLSETIKNELRSRNLITDPYVTTEIVNFTYSVLGEAKKVGTVEVNISSMGINGVQGVLVAVSDDGVGRSEAAQSRGFSTKQGLKILQQQIEFYNRDTLHKIQQHVTDLTDTQGLPAGTRFEIWIPADFKY